MSLKPIKMKPLYVKALRFFCAGAIITASAIELLYPEAANAAVIASPFGGLVALGAAKKLALFV